MDGAEGAPFGATVGGWSGGCVFPGGAIESSPGRSPGFGASHVSSSLVPEGRLKDLQEGKFSRAERLVREGDMAGAKSLWLQIVDDPAQGDFARCYAGEALVGALTEAERDEVRHELLPLLERDVEANNYLNALSAAKTLRELHHPDCLAPLLLRMVGDPAFGLQDNGGRGAGRGGISRRPAAPTSPLRVLDSRPRAVTLGSLRYSIYS